MGFSIGDLLNDSVKRNRLAKGVQTANVLRAVNAYLSHRLGARSSDAKAITFKDNVVTVGCLNSAVSHLVKREEGDLIESVKESVPNATVDHVQTQVMQHFPKAEV